MNRREFLKLASTMPVVAGALITTDVMLQVAAAQPAPAPAPALVGRVDEVGRFNGRSMSWLAVCGQRHAARTDRQLRDLRYALVMPLAESVLTCERTVLATDIIGDRQREYDYGFTQGWLDATVIEPLAEARGLIYDCRSLALGMTPTGAPVKADDPGMIWMRFARATVVSETMEEDATGLLRLHLRVNVSGPTTSRGWIA